MDETLAWRCLHWIETTGGDQTVMISSDLFLRTQLGICGIRPESFLIFSEPISVNEEGI